MDVELVYFVGCPNWQQAERRLREALASAGHTVTLQMVRSLPRRQQSVCDSAAHRPA